MKTKRMGIDYPSENQRSWFDTFVRGMNDIDGALFANREDRNILMLGGGTVAWNAVTNTLSWSADMIFVSPCRGFKGELASGDISISDGEFFYVNMTRYPGSNFSLSAIKGNRMPENNNAFCVCYRNGDTVYFRNGRSLGHGESGPLFVETVPGSGIYDWVRIDVEKQNAGDTWIGNGPIDTAGTQGGLSNVFPEPLIGEESIDVYLNGVLIKNVSGAPANQNEWRWIDAGAPSPVIEIGSGGSAGDMYVIRYPRGKLGSLTNYLRAQVEIQVNGDTWIGNDSTDTAGTQGGLSNEFPVPIVDPQAIDVFYNGVLTRRVNSAPSSTLEWVWVETGFPDPAPVIEIGAGSTAGDLVVVRYPYV